MDALFEFVYLIVKKFIVWLVATQIAWMNGAADNQIITVVALDVLILYALSPLVMRKGKRTESMIVGLIIWIVLRVTFEILGSVK